MCYSHCLLRLMTACEIEVYALTVPYLLFGLGPQKATLIDLHFAILISSLQAHMVSIPVNEPASTPSLILLGLRSLVILIELASMIQFVKK